MELSNDLKKLLLNLNLGIPFDDVVADTLRKHNILTVEQFKNLEFDDLLMKMDFSANLSMIIHHFKNSLDQIQKVEQ